MEKIHARDQKKRALSLVCICLCDETIHSYERKTNGVKRERVLRSPLVLQIYRCVRAYKIPSRNEVLSLVLLVVFFVLWDEIFFFLNLPHKKTNQLPNKEKGLNKTKMASCAQHQLLSSSASFRGRVGKTSSSASSSCSTSFSSPSSRGERRRGRRAAISYAESSSSSIEQKHRRRHRVENENRTSQIYSTRQKSRRKRRFGGNSPRRTGFFPRPRRTRPGRKRRNVYG